MSEYEDVAELERNYHTYCVQCDETSMYDQFMAVTRAEGDRVWDSEGREYLDLVLGYSALNFGHRPPELMAHARELLGRMDHVHSFASPEKIELSRVLANRSGIPGAKVYFPVSGAMAVEAALKLSTKRRVMAFENGFHGYSCAALHLSGQYVNKRYIGCDRFSHLPYGDMDSLEAADWPDVGLALFEPVQGANGFIIPPADWVRRLREVTRENNVVLVADEIQMGMGRAGHFASYQHFGIVPDAAIFSKSLAGGLWPLSAVVARGELFDAIDPAGSAIGSTFGNNQYACALALFIQQNMLTEELLQNVRGNSPLILDELKKFETFPYVKSVWGIGYAFGVELTDAQTGKSLQNFAHRSGVLLYVGGAHKNRLKIVFPVTAGLGQIKESLKTLRGVFEAFH